MPGYNNFGFQENKSENPQNSVQHESTKHTLQRVVKKNNTKQRSEYDLKGNFHSNFTSKSTKTYKIENREPTKLDNTIVVKKIKPIQGDNFICMIDKKDFSNYKRGNNDVLPNVTQRNSKPFHEPVRHTGISGGNNDVLPNVTQRNSKPCHQTNVYTGIDSNKKPGVTNTVVQNKIK